MRFDMRSRMAERVMSHARFMVPGDEAGAAGSGSGGSAGEEAGGNGDDAGGKSFDDFLKDPKQQAEFDRRVQKALETNKAKLQADMDKKIEAAKTEAEKMAAMNAEQKAQYEREQKEAELKTREASITKRELMAAAKEQLAEKGLPLSLAAVLDYSGAEECTTSIESVEKAFKEAVDAGVESRLAGGKPPKKAQDAKTPDLKAQVYQAMKGAKR